MLCMEAQAVKTADTCAGTQGTMLGPWADAVSLAVSSVRVDERGLIRCVRTLTVRRHVSRALGREVAPAADRGPVHASEVGGLLAVDSKPFGDEHTRDCAVIVAKSAATAHQSGQLEVGVG